MFISIDFVLNVSYVFNIVVFDKTNSVINATIAKMLRNSIFLILQKMNSRRAHSANGDNKRDKT